MTKQEEEHAQSSNSSCSSSCVRGTGTACVLPRLASRLIQAKRRAHRERRTACRVCRREPSPKDSHTRGGGEAAVVGAQAAAVTAMAAAKSIGTSRRHWTSGRRGRGVGRPRHAVRACGRTSAAGRHLNPCSATFRIRRQRSLLLRRGRWQPTGPLGCRERARRRSHSSIRRMPAPAAVARCAAVLAPDLLRQLCCSDARHAVRPPHARGEREQIREVFRG